MKSAFGLTGYSSPRKPLSSSVPEGRAAEGVRPPRRADHRDRARPQHPLDGRDRRDPVAVLELAPRVLAQLGRELELDPVRRGVHLDREAGLAEHADHAPVLGQDGRGERRHAARGGDLGEVGDQDRGQPAALHLVGDREGDLGAVGPLELEDRVGDDALLGAGGDDQAVALGPVALRGHRGRLVEVDPEREEPQPARVLAEAAEERAQRRGVGRRDGPDPRGRAVAQRDVDIGGDGCAHTTASRIGSAPKRTGSVAGSPVSSDAAAQAVRAAASSRARVLSAIAETRAGRTQPIAPS